MAETGEKQEQSDHFRDATKKVGHRKHYLYHVTSEETVPSVMQGGLIRRDAICSLWTRQ